jgi:hypothetical protein
MGKEEVVAVRLVKNQSTTTGELKMVVWSKHERMWRAGRALAICWSLALFCVLIPVLHFVLVPFFLLLGPFVAFALYSDELGQLGGSGICPECKKEFNIVSGKKKFPFDDVCNHCRAHFTVEKIQ